MPHAKKETKLTKQEKQNELKKYRDLTLATLDYYIESPTMKFKTADFDSEHHYGKLKIQVEEHFQHGRLTRLKQWFQDLTEMPRETGDYKFNEFVTERTGHEINLHQKFDQRISKILDRHKIKTANEYRDVLTKVDYLCHSKSTDQTLIEQLNTMLTDFEKKKR